MEISIWLQQILVEGEELVNRSEQQNRIILHILKVTPELHNKLSIISNHSLNDTVVQILEELDKQDLVAQGHQIQKVIANGVSLIQKQNHTQRRYSNIQIDIQILEEFSLRVDLLKAKIDTIISKYNLKKFELSQQEHSEEQQQKQQPENTGSSMTSYSSNPNSQDNPPVIELQQTSTEQQQYYYYQEQVEYYEGVNNEVHEQIEFIEDIQQQQQQQQFYQQFKDEDKSPKKLTQKQKRELISSEKPPIKPFNLQFSGDTNMAQSEYVVLKYSLDASQSSYVQNKTNTNLISQFNELITQNEPQLENELPHITPTNAYQLIQQYTAEWWNYLFEQNKVVSSYEFYLRLSEAITIQEQLQEQLNWQNLRKTLPTTASLITQADFEQFFNFQWSTDERRIIEKSLQGEFLQELKLSDTNTTIEREQFITRQKVSITKDMRYLVLHIEQGLVNSIGVQAGESISIGVDGYTIPQFKSFFPENKMVFIFGKIPQNQEHNYGVDFNLGDDNNAISKNHFAVQVKYIVDENTNKIQFLFRDISDVGQTYIKVQKKPYKLHKGMVLQLGEELRVKVVDLQNGVLEPDQDIQQRYFDILRNVKYTSQQNVEVEPIITLEVIEGSVEGVKRGQLIILGSTGTENRDYIIGNIEADIVSNNSGIQAKHSCLSYVKNFGWVIKTLNKNSLTCINISECENQRIFELELNMYLLFGNIFQNGQYIVMKVHYMQYPDEYESEIDIWSNNDSYQLYQ